jgi:hypothetical protein
LIHIWPIWRSGLVLVQPDTVVRWWSAKLKSADFWVFRADQRERLAVAPFPYDRHVMPERARIPVRTILRVGRDLVPLMSSVMRSRAQPLIATMAAANRTWAKNGLPLNSSSSSVPHGYHVAATTMLGGLHQEYRLEPEAARTTGQQYFAEYRTIGDRRNRQGMP